MKAILISKGTSVTEVRQRLNLSVDDAVFVLNKTTEEIITRRRNKLFKEGYEEVFYYELLTHIVHRSKQALHVPSSFSGRNSYRE